MRTAPGGAISVKEKTIAVCESGKQVAWLLGSPGPAGTPDTILAVNPEADWALRERNVPFLTLDAFQRNREPSDVEALQAGQIAWARRLDGALQVAVPAMQAAGFCPARYYLFYLKNYWDTFIVLADALEKIREELDFSTVMYFADDGPLSFDSDLMLRCSALSHCIPLWADHHAIRQVRLPPRPGDTPWATHIHMKRNWIHALASGMKKVSGCAAGAAARLSGAGRHAGSGAGGRKQLIVRKQYDITARVMEELEERGTDIVPFDPFAKKIARSRGRSPPELSRQLDQVWQEVSRQDWFVQPGGWQEWKTDPLLIALFRHFYLTCVPQLWERMGAAQEQLARGKPDGILCGSVWGLAETGLVMAARAEGIPVFFYQHGSSMGDIENTIWDLTDLYYADYTLLYGMGPAEYAGKRAAIGGLSARSIVTGSARLDLLQAGRRHAESPARSGSTPFVLYIPSSFSSNLFRYDYTNFRNSTVFSIRLDAARLFHDRPGFRYGYKAFLSRGYDPTPAMLARTCPACQVINDVPLSELQWEADLLVYETPSTGMYEGLLTDKPVIVLADRGMVAMPDDVRELLGRRATVCGSGPAFIRAIGQVLDRGLPAPLAEPDRGFLKRFGTHADDGKSAERAADAIGRIIGAGKGS